MATSLPVEVVTEILTFAIAVHPIPANILCAHTLFRHIGLQTLHQSLCFRSSLQLRRFIHYLRASPLACTPLTLTLDIAGGASESIFPTLDSAFTQISLDAACRKDPKGRVMLNKLHLILHSHMRDDNLHMVYVALSKANPTKFIWTGPDPPHHFSTAIVPRAVSHLFRALSTYTNLLYLKLTNITFFYSEPLVFPNIPSLRSFYLGQATFLPAATVAAYLSFHSSALESVRLVDVYSESIWGPRIRKNDILAILAEHQRDIVATVLIVDAKTERIMGGDRVDSSLR
ncbi:uncharacterized protein BT62DRAFT_904891 [Guyanagaster necrorhizus]|uniref:Uncharacterized protein n=1 Tax=Guyanagaster necrorhizus TaxID=856835 RepID=A0A9P7VLK9_9AGAR|nr:uncharacterized protein BT62DRAFT_904891 [Guyanagaster necrorhizus MCA 3950]KAG7442862.1 hypothetical protein BT62DRAFT_904891 [Guyanagaster necrorhizus MCA 3950]